MIFWREVQILCKSRFFTSKFITMGAPLIIPFLSSILTNCHTILVFSGFFMGPVVWFIVGPIEVFGWLPIRQKPIPKE